MQKKSKTMTDPAGQAVPYAYVKTYDRERDKIARRILARWEKTRKALRRCKIETLSDISRLQALAEKTEDVSLGGKRGNMQFRSFDGAVTVSLDVQARTEFDERLALAQALIMEAVREISADAANADLVEIATRAFQPRSSGRLDMQRVRDLRTYNVKHAKWKRACEIIADCERKIGTREYVRVAVRRAPDLVPEPVVLDIARIDAHQEGGPA